jgi:hypothetical protein
MEANDNEDMKGGRKMKKLYAIVVMGLAVGIVCWVFGPGLINAKGNEIKASDLPEAERATLEKEAPGAEIEEIEKEEENGQVIYEIEVKIDGKEMELEIAADGTLLEKEGDEGDKDEDGDDGDDDDDDDDDEDDDDDDDDE